MKKCLKFSGLLVALLLLVACATTPKQKQLLTLETFNSVYEQYLDIYDTQTDATKAEWKVKVDPYWKNASAAIDAYMAIADPSSTDAQKKLAIYTAAKNQALKLLMTYGVEIKEDK